MKKVFWFFLILSFLSLVFTKTSLAEEKINKFGVHVLEISDLEKAGEILNSKGGDWGWVTVVIRDDDTNSQKWQDFMDQCRERHLVPIVRIATHLEGQNWVKPKIQDAQKWADFLDSLNWPVANQYVIVFNEPNQAKEWGGEVNPKEYAKILNEFMQKFKIKNLKLKILNAGLDLAAPNSLTTMDAFKFMQEMNWEVPGIFEKLDGWASHSYPNHGFLGKPWNVNRTSIRGYEWELSFLKNNFGVKKNLPVFITETGWPVGANKYYSEKTVADYLKYAFENVWLKDNRIKSVTPFILNYPEGLFAEFSWLKKDGSFRLDAEAVKNLPKIAWWPEQTTKYEMIAIVLPPFLPADTKYQGKLTLKNVGQSIWGEKESLKIPAIAPNDLKISDLVLSTNIKVKPNEITLFDFTLCSSNEAGEFEFSWGNLPKQKIKVYPASFLTRAQYTLWQKVILKFENFVRFFPV